MLTMIISFFALCISVISLYFSSFKFDGKITTTKELRTMSDDSKASVIQIKNNSNRNIYINSIHINGIKLAPGLVSIPDYASTNRYSFNIPHSYYDDNKLLSEIKISLTKDNVYVIQYKLYPYGSIKETNELSDQVRSIFQNMNIELNFNTKVICFNINHKLKCDLSPMI